MFDTSTDFRPSGDTTEALGRAAGVWGIEPGFWDIWGTYHATTPAIQRSILEAMEVDCSSARAIDAALEAREWSEWNRLAPPVAVLSEIRQPAELTLRLPSGSQTANVRVELSLETGEREQFLRAVAELPEKASIRLRGKSFVAKGLQLPTLPLGYHDVRIELEAAGGEKLESTTRLIVCPERAYLPPPLAAGRRLAGLSVALYGLRSRRNWGCGDFTDLTRLADWMVENRLGDFIGLNPLHVTHNREPYSVSPYLPVSVYYRNPIYLDVERIPDFENSSAAQQLRRSPGVEADIEALCASEFVEYERVSALKRRFLKLLFRTFLWRELRRETERARQFREYLESEGPLLESYALYAALDEWIHRRHRDAWDWLAWPEPYRDPDSPEVRDFALRRRHSILFHQYVQWQVDLQLADVQQHVRRRGMAIGLYHDLALATDSRGADLWAHNEFFVPGCRVGAPPDDFSPNGQDWSFPPPHSIRHRADGYRLFIESIRQNARHGGALRIDHVMRFFRLYWVPPGGDPTQGAYVRDEHEDLLGIVALESVRQKVLVVGEDLGTVQPNVREELDRRGILSYRLLYFERHDDGAPKLPHEYPRQALVASTTHDLPTLAGFWLGRDIEARFLAGVLPDDHSRQAMHAQRERDKQSLLDALFRARMLPDHYPRSVADIPSLTPELHNAFIGYLASTPCMLMALNQEDLTKETEQLNLPGTTEQYPNWRRKMRLSLEDLAGSQEGSDFAAMWRNWLEISSRTGG